MPLLTRNRQQDGPVKLKHAPDVDNDVQDRLKRGRGRMGELAAGRNECWEMFRGNTYVVRTKENQLVVTSNGVSVKGGDPSHRVRTRRPIMTPMVRQEVSVGTQRAPSYDVIPANTDPETYAAAKVSEKVALYGYEQWNIEQVMDKVVTGAVVADEHFAWPYWDTQTGPVVGEDDQGPLQEGEVCIRTYTSNEVGWEPGVRFEDARWHFIQQARPVDDVLGIPGVLVSELTADATDKTIIGSGKPTSNTKLVLVTEYLERPSVKHPRGRRVVTANEKRIMPVEPYPLTNSRGETVDEPVLLKLSVLVDPDSDHDHGLAKFVLDAVRTYQECTNKALQYSKHMLPQMIVPPGTMVPFDDTPMAVFEHPRPEQIRFRESPGIPQELFQIADRAREEIAFMFSQNSIPSQVEAGKAIQALLDRDETVRAKFLKNVAKFHAQLMHRCLNEVQLHYTEPRDLLIVGDFGPDYMNGFMGADLLHQTTVRVMPESLEVRTRAQIKQDVITWAQLGWITPEDAIAAIQNGTTDELGSGFEYDRARAYLIIQKIKQGPQALFSMPVELTDIQVPAVDPAGQPIVDPATGQPQMQTQTVEAQGWMPRDVDNVRIHKAVFAKWFKSAEWLRLDPGMREAARQYWRALDLKEAEENARLAAQQQATAEGLGMGNAAKPQYSPMPALPNPGAQPET